MNNDDNFKRENPNITAREYLCTKINPNITIQRLVNILNGKAKRITIKELCVICYGLDVEVPEFLKNIK